MLSWQHIVLLLVCITLSNAYATVPADREESESRALALNILSRAYPVELAQPESRTNLKARIYQRLSRAKIFYVSSAENFPDCGPGGLAFVYPRRRNPEIYLCEFYKTLRPSQKAQTLIHESAHLAGIIDECDATQVEVEAMRASGEGLGYRNRYVRRCQI